MSEVANQPPLPRKERQIVSQAASLMQQENDKQFSEIDKFMPSLCQVPDKFLPSLADLANNNLTSFDKELTSAEQVSEALPLGTYEFQVQKPSEREEVGELKAVDKMLKNQRELLRQQKQRNTPNQTLIARYESEIALLTAKREALKKDKRMGGFAQ
mgnify:CR=1 FL=1